MLGTLIGNYTISRKIGEGGMGTVYVAQHATLVRRAAVKVLLPELSNNAEVITRFFNEARAATAIRHPSIVEIFDFGFLPDASAYIVMELLEGESLASRRKQLGRLEPSRALMFARQIAGALAAAHERGIVHRDIKPDNLFVVFDPEVPGGERIKVLDFGIAKLASVVSDRSLTQTGSVLGTPTYMSPEQCSGAGNVDARADLYSLGCVLYELVCGQPQFDACGAGDLIAHHLYFAPTPPRSHDASIPEPIERLILWLLEKEPDARPQSARELVEAIDRLLSGSGNYTAAAQLAAVPRSADPQPTTPTTLSGAAGVTAAPAPARSSRWVIPVVACTLIGAAIAIILVIDSAESTSNAFAPAPATPAAALPSPPDPPHPAAPEPIVVKQPQPPDAPTTVHLAVESQPVGATVMIDGKVAGTTPFHETIERGTAARAYTIVKDGYQPVTIRFETETDRVQRVTLKKMRRVVPKSEPQDVGSGGVNPFDDAAARRPARGAS